jgi:dipeptidyl aminopeptidase/acylaminoacyl peptidase
MVKITEKTVYSYGHWPSPISAELVATQGVKISEPQSVGETLYWLETRPQESGRTALVCQDLNNPSICFDLLPSPHSMRTRIHEYGGGAYLATENTIFYVLDADQRIYQYDIHSQQIIPITPEGAYRYADFCFDSMRQQLIAIREDYTKINNEQYFPSSSIITIDLNNYHIKILAEGADFYSNPRLSPTGNQLSYLCWNHPDMPWDSTECVIADVDSIGNIIAKKIIAGGKNESIFQPQWSPQGDLFLVSDRNNWWNLYRWNGSTLEIVCDRQAEFAMPQWVFGMSTYGFLNDNEIFCCFTENGQWQLGIVNLKKPSTQRLTAIPYYFTDISGIHCYRNKSYFIAASATDTAQLWAYENSYDTKNNFFAITTAKYSIEKDFISVAKAISFPTSHHQICHSFYYPPINPQIASKQHQLPPLIVICHGGPTGATETSLNLKIQFWTSRGFAVLDVNYRGSTGYGREYRDSLKKQWGITDVIDVCSGIDYLIEKELIDKNNILIRGSSAGGFTVLAALTFSKALTGKNPFKAGASLYGIGDLEALAKDTHKFEARYLDSLVGDYPQEKATYIARSPIHHIDQLNRPLIFLQGMQDKIVPPSQAEMMVEALQTKGLTTKYVTFANEGHGFRNGENIQIALTAELNFYLQLLNTKENSNGSLASS